ncbi:MAG: ABC transporter ATP-binding protein [Thiomonas sp.]|uniref:ABC transporter ATP-binding protein n=1 Tax=Thiomonas sp. TaxID=2047785 RepID=UPI002A364F83|nr:ABC transporter ATP-binding protein [Thiomonas sp.]MDY0330118.1 ABC transporter ATP-binding protein [Thiomonas sp.]
MSSTSPAVSFDRVVKQYGRNLAVDGVVLDIDDGEFFGLLGPNGAGKTTLISMLAGLTRPTSGHVRVAGHDVQAEAATVRRLLGVVPQELVFDPFFTVRQVLRIQSGYFGFRKNELWIDELLHNLGLSAQADKNMRALSGGMKRRVMVAQALVHRPRVIVLDEPTAGVDVELRQSLWEFIARLNAEGHTVLLTTHYLEEAEALCKRIAVIKGGKVVALDRTEALLQRFASSVLYFRLVKGRLPVGLGAEQGARVALAVRGAQDVEQKLAALREAGCEIDDLELRRADLEDVFLELIGAAR